MHACIHAYMHTYSPRLGPDQLDLYQADVCINDLTVKHIPGAGSASRVGV